MIALIQRVRQAHVEIDGQRVGEIERGILALVAVERFDEEAQAQRLLQRMVDYRVFEDAGGRMNVALRALPDAGLLLVPQFTLAADTRKGSRPSFTPAAAPVEGAHLFGYLLRLAEQSLARVASGRFGAHMQVHSINDGPVTFWLQARAVADGGTSP